jgi:predicted solute-binding protein
MDSTRIDNLQIGMIPYWNLLPFKYELVRQQKYGSFELKSGMPTQINKWLQDGQVHLAPCSSICLSFSGFEMAVPMGVSSNGAVQSVYLGLQIEHAPLLEILQQRLVEVAEIFLHSTQSQSFDARRVADLMWEAIGDLPNVDLSLCPSLKVTKASATSNMLTKIIYNIWFGATAFSEMSKRKFSRVYNDQRPIELVIGDEALGRQHQFYKVIDLGQLWKDLTGLPFVFAVWQSRGTFINGWRRKILEIGEKAENRMKIEPSVYYPSMLPSNEEGKMISLADYWKGINYKLGANEFRGLLIFLSLARKLQEQQNDNSVIVKILRWQELIDKSPELRS